MADLYDLLNVAPDATPEELKRAYRQRASATHPDKGGDEEEFKRVAAAYEVLHDPKKRQRYDETGEMNEGLSIDQRALSFLASGFASIVESAGVDLLSCDIIGNMHGALARAAIDLGGKRKSLKKCVIVWKKALSRIEVKDQVDFMTSVLQQKLLEVQVQLRKTEREGETVKRASEILEAFTFKHDEYENPALLETIKAEFESTDFKGTFKWA